MNDYFLVLEGETTLTSQILYIWVQKIIFAFTPERFCCSVLLSSACWGKCQGRWLAELLGRLDIGQTNIVVDSQKSFTRYSASWLQLDKSHFILGSHIKSILVIYHCKHFPSQFLKDCLFYFWNSLNVWINYVSWINTVILLLFSNELSLSVTALCFRTVLHF